MDNIWDRAVKLSVTDFISLIDEIKKFGDIIVNHLHVNTSDN